MKNAKVSYELVKDAAGRNTNIKVKSGDIDQVRNRRDAKAKELIKKRTGKDPVMKPSNTCPEDDSKEPTADIPEDHEAESALLSLDLTFDRLLDLDALFPCGGPCRHGTVIVRDCPNGDCSKLPPEVAQIPVPEIPEPYPDPGSSTDESTGSPGGSTEPGGGSSYPGGGSSYPGGGSSYPGGGGSSYPGGGGGYSSAGSSF